MFSRFCKKKGEGYPVLNSKLRPIVGNALLSQSEVAREVNEMIWLRQSLSGADLTKPVIQLLGSRKQVVGYLAPVIGTKVRGVWLQSKKS